MNSVVSYPSRGNFGKSDYRGNCSGFVIEDLINHFNPKLFVDVCEGSGTSRDVCKKHNVNYIGLDLHNGFDFTQQSVLNKVGRPADMVFSHPPYHDMIDYSKERVKHGLESIAGNDLSQCRSVEEFLELANTMLLNQREATKNGGIYTTLIGDMRKNGNFFSFQSDFIKMMPKDELISVTIKLQHNTVSQNRVYGGKFIPILHEYLIIWKRAQITMAQMVWDKAMEFKRSMNTTWATYIRMALMNLGGEATLDKIYSEIENVAGHKVMANSNYKAKVRQQLQYHFVNVSRGRWASSTK
ncbi:MAG: hypothetical protein ABJH04_07930 [Cyclobacteriaceae bacterium]